MTLGERVRKIRRQMDLTQQDFGKRIGIKSNSVSLIESGGRNASDQVILAICREFDISEDWIRTGAGEMFEPEATNALDALVKERGISRAEQILIEKFLNLKPENRQAVMDYLLDVAAAISGTVTPNDSSASVYVPEVPVDEYNAAADIDIDAEVARYRAELEDQKKAAEKLQASDGTAGIGEKMA
ncbi:helix-turn-helix domain-containing protein [Acutalibacter sp. 1XD8-36]|uniref:helix-turn-helix domain-containing protein n=1 Tax=Acutalibacter sp. 1XD8-36 TaxID=2320852 RepID=UPI0014133B8B|nr:helix-turn-helix transcriptional regulator [Acutalibacter sp. 1XD8-36]